MELSANNKNVQISKWLKRFKRIWRKRFLMLLIGLLTALDFFENSTFLFAASPIMGGIHADPREFAHSLSAYAIGSMLMIVVQQWASKKFGYKAYLLVALGLFISGTLLCINSENFTEFFIARVIQGVGGGAFFTSSRILITILFAPKDRSLAIRTFVFMIFGATAIAPIVAAYCVDGPGWKAVFECVIPPSIIAFVLCLIFLPSRPRGSGDGKNPILAFVTFGAGVILLQIMLAEARYDFFSDPIKLLVAGIIGALIIIGFFWLEHSYHTPILKLRNLHHPLYLTGLVVYFLYYFLNNFSAYLFPMFSEKALSLPIIAVGWLNGMAGFAGVIMVWVFFKYLAPRPKRKLYMVIGMVCLMLSATNFAIISPQTSYLSLVPALILKGVATIFIALPTAGLTFRGLEAEHFPYAYQSKNIVRQMAGSISIAIVSILLEDREFVVNSQLSANLTPNRPEIAQFINSPNPQLSLDILAQMVNKQAQFIAAQNLYILMGIGAFITAIIIIMQKKIR